MTMPDFHPIEFDVPIPSPRGRIQVFLTSQLRSIPVNGSRLITNYPHHQICSRCAYLKKRHNMQYVTRKTPDGIRVWRTR